MTVDEALEFADMGGDLPSIALAAEVRRLRAAVERVRALPRKCRNDEFADGILDRDDVLAALESE